MNFQINPAVLINIEPSESRGSNLVGVASEGGDGLALHIADGWRIDSRCARCEWTSRVGIVGHNEPLKIR